MAVIAPAEVVVGAPRIPVPYGLFSVLAPRPEGEGRWQHGVAWEALACGDIAGIGQVDCDPAEILGLPKNLEDGAALEMGAASAFTVYGTYQCSPIGNTFEYAQTQADLDLTIREEARVEQALWTGDLENDPNFADLPSIGSVALTAAWSAVALLEQHLAETYGSQGVIHMSRFVATLLFDDGKLEKRGGRLYTALDTPVVAGSGYGNEKIVGTPPLFGYRSDIFTSSNRPGDLLDRAQNNMHAIAERTYLLGFDPCGGASVTLTAP